MDERLVPLEEIRAARAALPPEIVNTPLLRSEELGEIAGAPVWLKTENLQVTGSYKARAAYTMLRSLPPEQQAKGAAISSSGNFASAWAYMGRLLGIPTAVVMQESTSPLKIAKTRRYGAEVILCENDYDARWRTLFALEPERGIRAINTFENRDVIRGHGTIGLEMVEALDDVETVLVPVSSGGLIAGLATAVKELRPSARVIGVQPTGSAAVYESFRRGEVYRLPELNTICDALIAAAPGALPLAHIQRYVDEMVLVTDEEVKGAIRWLVEHAKLVTEAGGAVGVAALLTGKVRTRGKTIVLLSGGNIMPETLAQYIHAVKG
ncbi:MAG: threonine/serine dehydratase [Armatimonadota bacterium]